MTRPPASETLWPMRPAQLLDELARLVRDRAPAELEIPNRFATRNAAAESRFETARRQLAERYEEEKAATEEEYARARREIVERCETEYAGVQNAYDADRAGAAARFQAAEAEAKHQLQEAQWEATTIYEAAMGGSPQPLEEITAQMDARGRELAGINRQAEELLKQWGQWQNFADPAPSGRPPERNPVRLVAETVTRADAQLRQLSELKIPRLFEGVRPLWLVLLVWAAMVPAAGAIVGWSGWQWAAVSGAAALAVSAVAGAWLFALARRKCEQAYLALRQALADAGLNRPEGLALAKRGCARLYEAVASRRDAEMEKAQRRFTGRMADLNLAKQQELDLINKQYPPRLDEIAARRDAGLRQADETYPRRLREQEERHQRDAEELTGAHDREMLGADQDFRRQWAEMAERWHGGLARFQTAAAAMQETCARLFPGWKAAQPAAAETPPAVRFGQYHVALSRIEGGIPRDERLRPDETEFTVPALLPFPNRSLWLLKAGGEGRDRAVEATRNAMLRLLTAIPPGKVRFTIFDPVGLGENFSAFMHLADFDEKLVGSRIWTDAAHFEQRLADLTEHMENVIQLYLRNEFASIRQYNASAGEMAEPYRVLVVANFPANFSETAARRLVSVVTSGARCGVFAIVGVDTRLGLPRDFDLADLEAQALTLNWRGGRFEWDHPEAGPLPVELERPPPPERFTELVRSAGALAKDAGRVEVSFDCVAPPPEEEWQADSREGIDVALGRAGAMKSQHLRLGDGTSQHVLIAGKTGSGKSNLLHVLVTNLALRYRPDQVELYLVDFKKGVEFKAYAGGRLPHARVIAIESEREFGLSVLKRLDDELKHRGELFRRLGVQEIKAARAADPGRTIPRVLLIVDEFQELFVEDDRIAAESSLLLDRLVRQGRAFGIHVLLGSQTLAGAYSLPRSTIGQMAVRIALQCSDSDAHLILSEENTAARLLARPGEAIYNDANGLLEGNHPFQIVWLPERERDRHLGRVRELAQQCECACPPPVVFEGSAAADPRTNGPLGELLRAASWPAPAATAKAWLGSAVAIKEPTAAEFRRQAGANLMVVGHGDELAEGMLASCAVSLAAQHAPDGELAGQGNAQFYLFDAPGADASRPGLWQRLAELLPHATRLVPVRSAGETVAEIVAEVRRRMEAGADRLPPIYLFVTNLARFRELRRAEDDFGFGRFGDEEKPASPAKQFAEILREGPAVGVHTLIRCESYTTASRFLDRASLRDLELRVLLHVSATDSSNLIESPAASQLGVYRAILYDEGQGFTEKLCPYGRPTEEWLRYVGERLRSRHSEDSWRGDAGRIAN